MNIYIVTKYYTDSIPVYVGTNSEKALKFLAENQSDQNNTVVVYIYDENNNLIDRYGGY